jgi:hypothetical protein
MGAAPRLVESNLNNAFDEDLEPQRATVTVREPGESSRGKPSPGDAPPQVSRDDGASRGCTFPECTQPAIACLLAKGYCIPHFIAACYDILRACELRLAERPVTERAAERMRSFLAACVEQSSMLAREAVPDSEFTRARLMDIRYTAGELRRRLRRSPRLAVSRVVRLRCEASGRDWNEQTRTLQISRYGAMVECRHLVGAEDRLYLEWLDQGRSTRARMVWRKAGKFGCFTVGVELLDSDNFWGLDWGDWVNHRRSRPHSF